MKALALFLLLTLALHAEPTSPVTLQDLRTEGAVKSTTVSTITPRFGWALSGAGRGVQQTACHILVASTPEKLAADEGDLWDSTLLPSNRSQDFPYRGAPLKDGQRVFWKVRIQDRDQKLTVWSAAAEFQVAQEAESKPRPLYRKGAPPISAFECAEPALNNLYLQAGKRIPQLTSLRDIQLTLRAACYHQSLFPHAKDWFARLNAAVDDEQRYPATLPPDGSYGSTQSDAGIIAAHTLWLMSGDSALLQDHWTTLNGYIHARKKHDPSFAGRIFGTLPEDTLPANDPFPEKAVHLASHGLVLRIMGELARTAAKTPFELPLLQSAHDNLRVSFQGKHLNKKGALKYESLAGQLITLRYGLLSTPEQKKTVADQFLKLLDAKTDKVAFEQGPLAAACLLPVLTWTDNLDRAVRIAKVQNADTLSPVALANLSEWLIWMVAGIDSGGAGFQGVRLAPYIPSKDVLGYAKAHLDTSYGRISSHWHHEDDGLHYKVSLPANTFGQIILPATEKQKITEGGNDLSEGNGILKIMRHPDRTEVQVLSGVYHFRIAN